MPPGLAADVLPLEERLRQHVAETREIKQLREENTKLKRPVADLSLDKVMLAERRPKKCLKPVKPHEVMRYLMGRYDVSQRRGLPRRAGDAVIGVLPQSQGSVDGLPTADA